MTAFTAAITMAAGSILLSAGPASAATVVSQAQGRFLSGSVGATNLDSVVSLVPASATNDGTTANTVSNHPLDATVLNAVQADLGSGLNLFGAAGVITLGAVNQYASASSNGSSKAASGAVANNGAIAVGGQDGVPASDATVDLTKLLGTDLGVLSAGKLTVGAVSATANETAAGAQSGTYNIADLTLNLTSPLVSGLTSTLGTANVPTLLNGLSLPGLTGLSNLPSLPAIVASVGTVSSADDSITVNLSTGVVTVDVAAVLTAAGLDINNLDPNTELLPYVLTALTTQLVPALTSTVNDLVAQITTALGAIDLTIAGVTLPIGAVPLASLVSQVTAPLTAALPTLNTTVAGPLGDALSGLLSLTANVQSTTTGKFTESALRLTLIPGATPAAVVRLASASVGANAPLSVPTTLSLAPNRGPVTGGTVVVITGTGFVPGGTSVIIGGNIVAAGNVAVNTGGTTTTFTTPAHVQGLVDVTVTTGGGTSTPALTFTYDPLTATSLNPTHGPLTGGTSVTVTGTGFVPGATTVLIGGHTVPAASVSVNPSGTTATFSTPVHAVGPVTVTLSTPLGGTTAPALVYTYDPGTPTGLSINPTHGPAIGGTSVTVTGTGTGFVQGATSALIGGNTVPAGQVTVGNNGTIATFTTPAHAVGPVSVTLQTGFGTTTAPLTFNYELPMAQTISPNTGPNTGGAPVTITGSGFVANQTSVSIGGTMVPASAVTVTGSTSLTFITPAHPVGLVGVTVSTPQGTSTPALPYFYNTATCVLTGGNAATVTVTTSVGALGAGVGSTFSVTVGGSRVGTPTPVLPGIGGIVQAQASVPVGAATTTVSYVLVALNGSFTVNGGSIPCTNITPVQREAGIYHPLQSARLLDTRLSVPVQPGATYTLQVLGRGGVPATKVASLVANVTVTQPAKAGFLTVHPDVSRPNTSSVNFVASQTVANLMTAPVGADGKIRIYNGSTGTTHVLVDVSGYFSSGDTVAPGSYKRLNPTRILDTNRAIGVPTSTPVPANGILTLKVTGVGGVQATNVSAVALNLTVDQTKNSGFITVFKNGPIPQISSLNFQKAQTGANLVIAPVAPDGTIKIRNVSTGTVRLIADVSGYFLGGVAILDGEFVAVTPSRILDTRTTTPSVQPSVKQPVKSLGIITPMMSGRNSVPATGVSAVILNVTVDHPTSIGYITVYPRDPRPNASNLNFVVHQPKPNSVIAPLGSDGKVRMFNGSPGSVDLIADVSGYFISNPLR